MGRSTPPPAKANHVTYKQRFRLAQAFRARNGHAHPDTQFLCGSTLRSGVFGLVRFLHQLFPGESGWPGTWSLHDVVVTIMMRED